MKTIKKKILVVDDERTTCLLLENFLSEHEIVIKNSGNEAINWLEKNLPDLIISDIQMPEMNGFELLKKIRLKGFTKHTPVIMLSGNTESKERIKCYQLGAQDYLTKPFNPEELKEVTRKNLFPIHFTNNW